MDELGSRNFSCDDKKNIRDQIPHPPQNTHNQKRFFILLITKGIITPIAKPRIRPAKIAIGQ